MGHLLVDCDSCHDRHSTVGAGFPLLREEQNPECAFCHNPLPLCRKGRPVSLSNRRPVCGILRGVGDLLRLAKTLCNSYLHHKHNISFWNVQGPFAEIVTTCRLLSQGGYDLVTNFDVFASFSGRSCDNRMRVNAALCDKQRFDFQEITTVIQRKRASYKNSLFFASAVWTGVELKRQVPVCQYFIEAPIVKSNV